MRIGVPREAAAGEGRVALVPETVGRLVADGFEVVVERGAGAAAGYPDEGYTEAGATLREAGSLLEGVDTIVRVARPTADEVSAMAPGTTLIGFLSPLTDPEGIDNARARHPQLLYSNVTDEALRHADLVVLVTEWPEYVGLDPAHVKEIARGSTVIDGRNTLDAAAWKAAGWRYVGMGRG